MKSRKELLITASTFPRWDGDSTPAFVEQFASHLAKRGLAITVLAPHAHGAKAHEHRKSMDIKRFRYFWPARGETLAYDGGAVAKISKSPVYAMKLFLFMAALFANTLYIAVRKNVVAINAHWIIPQGFAAIIVKQLTGKRVVIQVHGGDIFNLHGKWLTKAKAFTLRQADAVVVNSSATLKACQAVHNRPDYVIIPMGVDLERFKPAEKSKALVKRYRLNAFTILFVGRLSEEKGVIYLLEALKRLREAGVTFKALIAGDGPEKGELIRFVEQNELTEYVIFVGWVNPGSIAEYYSVADVFVGPSIISSRGWQEALGTVFLEALACGVPIIATDTGGIADAVEDGKTGRLVPEKSAKAIYIVLRELYSQPATLQALSRNARKSMKTKFAWQSVIDRYLQVFEL